MSIKVMTQVWEHAPVSEGTLLVLLALADYAGDDGTAYPSNATLARKARLDERHVRRVIQRLIALELIEVDWNAGPRGVNVYRIKLEGGHIVRGDIEVFQMSPEPLGTVSTSLDNISTTPSRKTNSITAREAILSDADFLEELRQRWPHVDQEYEIVKWTDHVKTKPPKGNYRNSLRNWIQRASKDYFVSDGSVDWIAERYQRAQR
jgi:hypothetical protein